MWQSQVRRSTNSKRHSHFVILLGDFNDKSSAATERAQIDSLLTLFGKKQLITEPTHILREFFML